jgi:hypothetical protein
MTLVDIAVSVMEVNIVARLLASVTVETELDVVQLVRVDTEC